MQTLRLIPASSIALLVLTLSWSASFTAAAAEDAAPGQELLLANKCNLCHSVEALEIERKTKSEKLKGPDLFAAGSKHTAEWIVGFLKREELLNEKQHKKEFKGTDDDALVIAEWLVGLAAEEQTDTGGR